MKKLKIWLLAALLVFGLCFTSVAPAQAQVYSGTVSSKGVIDNYYRIKWVGQATPGYWGWQVQGVRSRIDGIYQNHEGTMASASQVWQPGSQVTFNSGTGTYTWDVNMGWAVFGYRFMSVVYVDVNWYNTITLESKITTHTMALGLNPTLPTPPAPNWWQLLLQNVAL